MKYNICVVTGTRADYGLLHELLIRLNNNPKVSLDLVVTGSHLSDKFGNTQGEIINDGFSNYTPLPIPLDDDTKEGMAKSTGNAISIFTDYFSSNRPDILVVLGDRYEILAASISAHFLGIPIAHISGGDITEGAIDNAIRHSITKMSSLHFPGCEQSKKRIIQMGEDPSTVFNVGEPGVENCLKTDFLSREELADSIRFTNVLKDYSVVTFHPVTLDNSNGIQQILELIKAMDAFPDMSYIITLANADAGGREINDYWKAQEINHKNWLVVPSLGVKRYLSALKYSKLVLGNSSSGIVEAPALGIPTVNIGDRQKGRMISESVVCCNAVSADIQKAITKVLSPDFQGNAKHVISPFGNGSTSELIEKYLLSFLSDLVNKQNTKKSFHDI